MAKLELTMDVPKLLTIQETAEILRMSRSGVMNLIAREHLPGVHVPSLNPRRAGRVLVDPQDLREYIESWKDRNGQ